MTPGRRIDLHVHTTASDGLLDPVALVLRACACGIDVLGITDHDTAAGVRALAAESRVSIVPAIEISSAIGDSELHVLGYFIDPAHVAIRAYEDERRTLRLRRIEAMTERLRGIGIDVTMAEVEAEVGGDGAPGRPHLARVLVRKGYATSMRDCFDRLLVTGGAGHVPYPKLGPEESVSLIEATGGVAVIAHPGLDRVHEHLETLVRSGMRGIEVWHSAHSALESLRFEQFARTHDLLMTGGSDFHGPGREEGGELGATLCPPACFEALCAARR